MLTPEQIKELDKPLDNTRLKHRAGGGGMQLNYLAGYDVIATANRIFGAGEWGYDLLAVEMNNVSGEDGQVIGSYYSARVRLSVKECVPITEEGVCAVQAGRNSRAVIDSHDMARKGAITDALKRAFRCYGDQFGNSLYDKDYDASTGGESHPTPIRQGNQPQQQQQAARPVTQPKPIPAQPAPAKPTPASMTNGEKATETQTNAILRMSGKQGWEEIELNNRLKELYGYGLSQLTKNDAGHFIQVLQSK